MGVDGTVYKKHPTFKDLLSDKVQMLCKGTGIDVEFALSFDGSGKGAALITAVARRLAQTKVCFKKKVDKDLYFCLFVMLN